MFQHTEEFSEFTYNCSQDELEWEEMFFGPSTMTQIQQIPEEQQTPEQKALIARKHWTTLLKLKQAAKQKVEAAKKTKKHYVTYEADCDPPDPPEGWRRTRKDKPVQILNQTPEGELEWTYYGQAMFEADPDPYEIAQANAEVDYYSREESEAKKAYREALMNIPNTETKAILIHPSENAIEYISKPEGDPLRKAYMSGYNDRATQGVVIMQEKADAMGSVSALDAAVTNAKASVEKGMSQSDAVNQALSSLANVLEMKDPATMQRVLELLINATQKDKPTRTVVKRARTSEKLRDKRQMSLETVLAKERPERTNKGIMIKIQAHPIKKKRGPAKKLHE